MKRNAPPQLAFRRRESVRHGVDRMIDVLVRDTAAQASRPASEREDAVHCTRLALKRLRALIRLLRPSVGDTVAGRENRRLRTAARRLAGVRDAAVGLRTLAALASGEKDARASAVAAVQQRYAAVVHDRNATDTAIVRALASAGAAAQTAARSLGRAPWKRNGWAAVGAGVRAGYRRVRRRLKTAREARDEADFHALRTAAKSLFYQVCLTSPASPRRLGPWLKRLYEMQSTLGDEHDLAVLDLRLAESVAALGGKEVVEATRKLIGIRQRSKRRQALREGALVMAARASDFVDALRRDWRRWRSI